jgi:dipeptidyl aminopeptidase/acylaminoacyl peptidase
MPLEEAMPEKQTAPYGSWKSPITSELVASVSINVGDIQIDGDDVYWAEMRPSENARYVIVKRSADGTIADITPPPFNARTRVHEYGGAAFAVFQGTVYFTNFADQRLYRQPHGGQPEPMTPEVDMRHADMVVDRSRRRLVCIREDHTFEGREAVNTIVDVSRNGSRVLVSGNNFYSNPRLSPDEARLAWLTWNHPNMPWDGTELWVGELNEDGTVRESKLVAGGKDESISQPLWSPDGRLYFVSDKTGWWNLYRWNEADNTAEPLHAMEAEFTMPQWALGVATYGFASDSRIICVYNELGTWHIADLNTETLQFQRVPTPYTDLSRSSGMKVTPDIVLFGAGSPTMGTTLMIHELKNGNTYPVRETSGVKVDDAYLSIPETIEFPTENGLTAHAFFYPPKNGDFVAPDGEKPPLLVISHGGPTSATTTTRSLATQFWTSLGIGVVDVNYGGSTGYGTEYRRRLNGMWGVVDVDDCINAAKFLVERGDADGERLMIRGGSAGGYTTLAALTFKDVFKAGASYYGLSELEVFVHDTHKFESRYLDSMIGPYPEKKDLYYERSPINFTDQLSCPVILLQGLEDKIVPPNQAELMFEALRQKGIPVAYVPFEGEQHGFRKAENIKRALDVELYFYSRVFGFATADAIEPVEIENL